MDKLLDTLSGLVDEHLGDKIKLDLSSLLQGKLTIDPSHYVDKAITKLQEKMEELNMNEFKIPDFATEYTQPMCCVALPGEINFKENLLSGLTSLKRWEPTEVKVDVSGDKLISASTSIGISELNFISSSLLNVLFLESASKTKAVLKDVQLKIGLGITKGLSVSLDKFDFDSEGKLTDFAGLPDFVLEPAQEIVEKKVREYVKNLFEKDIKTLFAEIISKLEFLQ